MKKFFYTFLSVIFFSTCDAKEENKGTQVETRSATNVTDVRATLWGRIIKESSSGVKECGIEFNEKKMLFTTTQADSFGVHVHHLEMAQSYLYKAYAVDNNNVVTYGNVKEFTTLIPIGFGINIKEITDRTADIEFANTGQLRDWGLYYRMGGKATTADIKLEAKGKPTVTLDYLIANTVYHILAYATDINGVTSFIEEHFETKSELPYPIEVNANVEKQEIDGFGASDGWRCQMVGRYWHNDKKEAIADLLFSRNTDASGNPLGIGLSMWRFNIGAGSAEQGNNSSIPDEWRRAECFQNADGTYDWTKQSGQQWFARAAKARGVEQFIGFSISAPVHMTKNGKAFNSSGINMNIVQDGIPRFAAFLADVAEYFHQQGMSLTHISPVNEPQWNWLPDQWGQGSQEGTPATNREIAALVKSLNAQLVAKSLSTKIGITDAGQIDYLYMTKNGEDRDDQIRRFFSPSSDCYVGNLSNIDHAVSAHSYWSVWNLANLVSQRQTLNSSLKNLNLKYWQSEYCILESPGTAEIPNGDGNKRDLGMATALFVARIIHADMTVANASSWQWWTALSRCDYKDGLIYLDDGANNGIAGWPRPADYCKTDGYFRTSKLLWMLGNYSYFVRPGMVRIEVAANNNPLDEINKGLMVSAYKDKSAGKIVLVCVNYSNTERRCGLKLHGMNVDKLVPYITSETQNLEKQQEVNASEFIIPARSVVTFVNN